MIAAILYHLPGLRIVLLLSVAALASIYLACLIWWATRPTEWEQDEADRLGIVEMHRTPWEWVAYVAAGLWRVLWAFLDLWPRKRVRP